MQAPQKNFSRKKFLKGVEMRGMNLKSGSRFNSNYFALVSPGNPY
jgi:hypothetical protein